MKASIMLLICVLGFCSFQNIQAQDSFAKETIKVWGNCGMCKTNIEKAAMAAGATNANWSVKKKTLKMSFDATKTNSSSIQQAIAAAGYDTQDFTANQEAYDNLHGCCQYERKAVAGTSAKACCKDGKGCKSHASCDGKDCCKDGKACTDGKACAEKGCCKEKSCCASTDKASSCCKEGQACTDHKACADKGCCSGKSCCKS